MKYGCETCDTIPCPYHILLKEIYMDDLLQISVCLTERERVTKCVGCASHSDFVSEREKVLNEVYTKLREKIERKHFTMLINMADVDKVFAELRRGEG